MYTKWIGLQNKANDHSKWLKGLKIGLKSIETITISSGLWAVLCFSHREASLSVSWEFSK